MRSQIQVFTTVWLIFLLIGCEASGTSPTPMNPSPNPPNPNQPPVTGACAVTISEDITVSSVMTNTASACDYLITKNISVENGTLTIEAGVVVQFAQDTRMRISDNAQLMALGQADKRIRFEAQAAIKGYAYGLYFTSPLESKLEYVDVINLGKEDTGLFAGHDAAIDGALGSGLSLKQVSVSGSNFNGAELNDINVTAFENNRFSDNAFFGLKIAASQAHKLDAQSDYNAGLSNGRPYIFLDGIGGDSEVYRSATWKALNTPYYIDITVNINAGTLTLEPGIEFVMAEGASFDVDGLAALKAIGTQEKPIVFRGEQAQAGYWDGVYFFESDSRSNLLDFVEVRHAGGGRLIEGAISVGLESYLKMTNSVVADSGSWGVCVTYISERYQAIFEEANNSYFNNPLGNVVFDCD